MSQNRIKKEMPPSYKAKTKRLNYVEYVRKLAREHKLEKYTIEIKLSRKDIVMEIAKELLLIFGRIITILPLLLGVTLLMGKRSVAELPVFDFLIIFTLGSVVGADLADPKIPHLHTAVAIVLIALFQMSIAKLTIKNRRFGKLITFEPTIVIKDGKFLVQNMKKIRYSLDTVLVMLRENNIFNIQEVELAIIEANGKLTVLPLPNKKQVTREDMGILNKVTEISYTIIVEGKVINEVLDALNIDEIWLKKELQHHGLADYQQIFYASINEKKEVHISLRNPILPSVQIPIRH